MNQQKCDALLARVRELQEEMKEYIIETLNKQGRITLPPVGEDGDYPVSTTMYGKYDNPTINITGVYNNGGEDLLADGIDAGTGEERTGFYIYGEQLADVLYFIRQAAQVSTGELEQDPPTPTRMKYVYTYPVEQFERDAPDEEILLAARSGSRDVNRYTVEAFAELVNDEFFNATNYWVRVIETTT